jgi:1-aminocyclopropane-1-carboxylate deaminase
MTNIQLNNQLSLEVLEEQLAQSCIQNIKLEPELAGSYQLDIKRDDLIHPIISGNKWRKLKFLLRDIESKGIKRIAAMGGRHSNFLHALAYACHRLDWHCQFFVRGYPEQPLTPTLLDCKSWGADIQFCDRTGFKLLREQGPELEDGIYWIPEGGLQFESTQGIAEIIAELPEGYDYIVIASATGTSVAGLVKGWDKFLANQRAVQRKVIGIAVLNNQQQQKLDVTDLIADSEQAWEIKSGYEFGGFAKNSEVLDQFCQQFFKTHKIAIEPIYTGRSFYAVFDLMRQGYFKQNSRILLIHSGGMQGARENKSESDRLKP